MMKTPPAWTPTVRWHLTCLGICAGVCVILFGALSLLSTRLPAPYGPRTPAHGTTPWNN